jgi:hypothetical protein
VANWLIAVTHNNLSYSMAATAIGIVSALAIRESAPAKVAG